MYHRRLLEAVAERTGSTSTPPWRDLSRPSVTSSWTAPETSATLSLSQPLWPAPGLHGALRRHAPEPSSAADQNTDSDNTRERIEGLMALQPCPACGGARLRPESLAVTVGGLNIYEYTRLSARAALEWIEALELTETERAIARLAGARDRRTPALPGQRRGSATCRSSVPRRPCRAARRSGSASRRRSDPRSSASCTSFTNPRSGSHQRDNAEADRHPPALAGPRGTP